MDSEGKYLDLFLPYHLQIDSQLERTIQVLENIFTARVLDFGRTVEFFL